MGMTCREVIERTIYWLERYESGTLDDEFAPPEIEVYFPQARRLSKPVLIIAENLIEADGRSDGPAFILPTASGGAGFFSMLPVESETERLVERISNLSTVIFPLDRTDHGKLVFGRWFRLMEEPSLPVPQSSADLMDLMVRSGRPASTVENLVRSKPRFVAVCYQTDREHTHWLIFETKFDYGNRDGFRPKAFLYKLREVNRRNQIRLYPTNQVSRETIFKRVSGFSASDLDRRTCLILGCGALGSRVAETIVKAGIGGLILVDNDILKAGNISRHVLGLDYLGWNKAAAMKDYLLRRNPFARVEVEDAAFSIVNDASKFEKLLLRSDLVICCLGNNSTEAFVSIGAVSAGRQAVFGRTHLQGRLGEILCCGTSKAPVCFHCAAEYIQSAECEIPRPPEIPYRELVKFDGDCGAAFIPASAVDLDLVALHIARTALSKLQGEESEHNYWLVRGREFVQGEYPLLDDSLRQAHQVRSWQIHRNIGCPVCGGEAAQ